MYITYGIGIGMYAWLSIFQENKRVVFLLWFDFTQMETHPYDASLKSCVV